MQTAVRIIRSGVESRTMGGTSRADASVDERQLRRVDDQSIEFSRHVVGVEKINAGSSTNVNVDDAYTTRFSKSNGQSRIVELDQFDSQFGVRQQEGKAGRGRFENATATSKRGS